MIFIVRVRGGQKFPRLRGFMYGNGLEEQICVVAQNRRWLFSTRREPSPRIKSAT
jgi:hypothetical protein